MKKNLFIMLGIFSVIIAILVYLYYNTLKISIISQSINREYETYLENNILGSTLMSVINKATDENEKNNVQKDEKGRYIQNDTNSVIIEVKFLESDKTYPMEAISKLGSEKFIKNYSSMTFKCTAKEYHSKTKRIKYILFEQVK